MKVLVSVAGSCFVCHMKFLSLEVLDCFWPLLAMSLAAADHKQYIAGPPAQEVQIIVRSPYTPYNPIFYLLKGDYNPKPQNPKST